VVSEGCTVKADPTNKMGTFTFKKLQWRKPGLYTFRLTFSTPMDYNVNIKSKDLIGTLMSYWGNFNDMKTAI
jgi:hypothetical protein